MRTQVTLAVVACVLRLAAHSFAATTTTPEPPTLQPTAAPTAIFHKTGVRNVCRSPDDCCGESVCKMSADCIGDKTGKGDGEVGIQDPNCHKKCFNEQGRDRVETRAKLMGCTVPNATELENWDENHPTTMGPVIHHDDDEQDKLLEELDDLDMKQGTQGLSEVENARYNFLLAASAYDEDYAALERKAELGSITQAEILELNKKILREQEANRNYIEALLQELQADPANADLEEQLEQAEKHDSRLHEVPPAKKDKGVSPAVVTLLVIIFGSAVVVVVLKLRRSQYRSPAVATLLTEENSAYAAGFNPESNA